MAESNPFGDFAGAINALAEEKGIDRDELFSTVEVALGAAYKKEYGERGQNVRAELNATSGDMKFWLVKEVVDETTREFVDPDAQEEHDTEKEKTTHKKNSAEQKEEHDSAGTEDEREDEEEKLPRFNPQRDILLEDAQKRDPDIKVGDTIEEELPTHTDFGRVAAQTAKQVIIQRVRESEREAMYNEYKEKEGEIVNGTVQRVEGRMVFVDLGKSVGVLFPREQVRGEHYDIGQRIKVYIESVELDPRGPGIKLSRVHPDMVRSLFEMEVPEIFAGTVEIKSIAREAGSRSKIAVYTEDEDIDPVGSCVGQKGMRVNAVIDALGGEKIDIIEWEDDAESFIAAALAPASVLSVELDEEAKRARVVVPDDQLSLAIGKRGQNVRLAVKLTGWDLDVESESGEGTDREKARVQKTGEETPQAREEESSNDSQESTGDEEVAQNIEGTEGTEDASSETEAPDQEEASGEEDVEQASQNMQTQDDSDAPEDKKLEKTA